jgi:hypothetical protein
MIAKYPNDFERAYKETFIDINHNMHEQVSEMVRNRWCTFVILGGLEGDDGDLCAACVHLREACLRGLDERKGRGTWSIGIGAAAEIR